LTLANTGVTAGTVGSSTQVGVVTFDAKGRITAASNIGIDFANANVATADYANNAGIATNLKDGQAYNIPYQSAANTTEFISNGTNGQLLQYNQSSAPSWVSAGDITAGIAETANNLAGGLAGSLPYQSAANTTVFLGQPGANNKILSYDNNAPIWIDKSSIETTQGSNNSTDIATNATDIGTNATDIATNATDIATNATDIATNATDIGTNATDIGTNATDIATNATDIATNATDIATAQSTADAAATVSNNSNDRVITGTNSGNDLNAESNLTFDGSKLTITAGTGSVELGSDRGNIELYRPDGGAYIDFKRETPVEPDYNVRIDNFITKALSVTGNINASGEIRSYFALARVQSGTLQYGYNVSSISTSNNRLRLNYVSSAGSNIRLFYAGMAQDGQYAGATVVGPAGGAGVDNANAADFAIYGTTSSSPSDYTLRSASQIDRITIIVEKYYYLNLQS